MYDDYFAIKDRLRARYAMPTSEPKVTTVELIGGEGFLVEHAGRVVMTAPASTITEAGQLPVELAENWEKAASGNPYMMWLQGRYVEAEKANRNGAFWSTSDLQYGEMSVKHGPLNWLHDDNTIIGTIADNALIHPQQVAAEPLAAGLIRASTSTNLLLSIPQPRPYMAAVSAVWRWINHDKAHEIERAADIGKLYYSMECVGREMSCQSDETHEGCGRSFDYQVAMTEPDKLCEHMAGRTSARRIVDPSFLGGAVIIPPSQPGWGAANVEVMTQSASMAEQTAAAAGDMSDGQWTALMAEVLRYVRT